MDIQSDKEIIIKQLGLIQDSALIEMVKNLLEYGLRNQEARIGYELYNKELQEAEEEILRGKGIGNEFATNQIKNW